MSKIISIQKNKDYKILSIDEIKKFLNIISEKDNDFLEKIYSSVCETASNFLGFFIGEAEIKIHYYKFQYYSSQIILDLKFGPVSEIKSINLIDEKGNIFEIKNFKFFQDEQKLIFEKNPNEILTSNFFIEIIQNSKIDSNHKNFETIRSKLLRHINIVYKNRNSFIFEKNDIDSQISNIYQDLLKLLN